MMSDFRKGGGGQAKLGQNRTRGVGIRAKIGHPIFQEFLPLFRGFLIFSFMMYFFSVTPP